MSAKDALEVARAMKAASGPGPLRVHPPTHDELAEAIVALYDHGESLKIPDFETSIRMVAAQMHAQGQLYIEIAVDPKTKEVGWTFEPTERDQSHSN